MDAEDSVRKDLVKSIGQNMIKQMSEAKLTTPEVIMLLDSLTHAFGKTMEFLNAAFGNEEGIGDIADLPDLPTQPASNAVN